MAEIRPHLRDEKSCEASWLSYQDEFAAANPDLVIVRRPKTPPALDVTIMRGHGRCNVLRGALGEQDGLSE
jgi:hypothetical protein